MLLTSLQEHRFPQQSPTAWGGVSVGGSAGRPREGHISPGHAGSPHRALLGHGIGPQLARQRLAAAAGRLAVALLLLAPRREREDGIGLMPCGAGSPAGPEPRREAGPRQRRQGQHSSLRTAGSSCSERSREDSNGGSCTLRWLAIRAA